MLLKGYVKCNQDAFNHIICKYSFESELQWLVIWEASTGGIRPHRNWRNDPIPLRLDDFDDKRICSINPEAEFNFVQWEEYITEQEFTKAALTSHARSWREAAALPSRAYCLETHVSGG
jgi:hypothetical protein